MSAKFIYLVGQVGSFGPCFLVQPELVISCDVTFNLTFIYTMPNSSIGGVSTV